MNDTQAIILAAIIMIGVPLPTVIIGDLLIQWFKRKRTKKEEAAHTLDLLLFSRSTY